MKALYLLVTEDEYELPIAVCDSIKELANTIGVNQNAITSCLCKYRKGKIKKSKYRKVLVE